MKCNKRSGWFRLFHQCEDTNLSPIIDAINVERKKIRQKVAGSLNTKIPTRTIPTAPIPVQTAYAVPIGNTCVALYNRIMLIERHAKNPNIQYIEIFPVVSFALPKHEANPTSKSPAMTSKIQLMSNVL